MKTMNHMAIVGLIGCLATLTGCVKLWQDNIDIKTYMVETNRAGDPLAAALAPKLWIDSVNVLPPFNVRNLILRQSDVEYITSYYSELLMSPSENFRNELFAWVSASGMFQEVSIVERGARSHSLVTTVMELYGDTENKEAVLRVKATLLDEKTRGDRVLLSKDYERRVAIADGTVEELIRAYNTALAGILADLESDMNEALKQ